MELAKTLWQSVLEILFPPICLNCRIYLQIQEERENLLCNSCFSRIKIYSNIFKLDPRFNLMAIGSYEDTALRELIHYFKYHGFLNVKIPLEKVIIKWLKVNPALAARLLHPHSLITPIPLHKKRLRERGFNQAEIISTILAKHLHLPLERNLLERTRDTKSQMKIKNPRERETNVKNSIRLKDEGKAALSQYQSIILVDDIYTSGATVKDAVRVLRSAGVRDITALVIAKT